MHDPRKHGGTLRIILGMKQWVKEEQSRCLVGLMARLTLPRGLNYIGYPRQDN